MKKLILSLAIMGFIATAAVAQEKTAAPSQNPQQQKIEWEKKVKSELNLTAEQATKYDALNKEYGEKFNALMSDNSLDESAKKEKKIALKKEKESKLFEFLTPEQQAKYKELMEKMMEKRKDPKPAGK